MRRIDLRALALDAAAKDEMPRHKFQPMPPNTRGAKSGLCNKCLEHRSHTNHYIDDTKLEKMKDTSFSFHMPVRTVMEPAGL